MTSVGSVVEWDAIRKACESALNNNMAYAFILNGGQTHADIGILTAEEKLRAAMYRRDDNRNQLILGRALIHHLVRPRGPVNRYPIKIAPLGKPYIEGRPAFSISHSGGYVACVVAKNDLIGIDVEHFDAVDNWEELSQMILHPEERLAILEEVAGNRRSLFRRCWTRKEAVLKATGVGLIDDLCSINVQLTERRPLLEYPAPVRVVDVFQCEMEVAVAIAVDVRVKGIVICYANVPSAGVIASGSRFFS